MRGGGIRIADPKRRPLNKGVDETHERFSITLSPVKTSFAANDKGRSASAAASDIGVVDGSYVLNSACSMHAVGGTNVRRTHTRHFRYAANRRACTHACLAT
eukprot:GHVU01160432.1.p1 GENE.GHVU01160432.1~~GHVU01160432.1.p1  ORF type:complete len:102 (-),score=1.41 GHVU01160432.1:79-384(-)